MINDYDYNMGGVDIVDQQKSIYKTQRNELRNWYPLFYWIFDHACINAFRVGCQLKFFVNGDHAILREFLTQDLLAFSANQNVQRNCMLINNGDHNLVRMSSKTLCQ